MRTLSNMKRGQLSAALLCLLVGLGANHLSHAQAWKCAPGSFGAGPGTLAIQDRTPTESFTSISVSNSACVEYVQGDRFDVRVEAAPDTLEKLNIAVENGSLKIRDNSDYKRNDWRNDWNSNRGILRVVVTAPSLNAAAVAGSGDIIASVLRAQNLKLSVAGSGDITINQLLATHVDASIAGSGDIRIAGQAQSLRASVAGSGDVDASQLSANQVKVSVAGSGDAKVWAVDSLEASVAGTGDVAYRGSPAQVKRSVVGKGDINRM
jgi:hypothetical protein